jgi:hypothetical protein
VFKHHTVVAGDETGSVATGDDDEGDLAYLNVNGRFVNSLRANELVADDLTLRVRKGCKLRRFSFQVSGRADPAGIGGPFRVFYSIYNTCPNAGGSIIGGVTGLVDFADDAPREVEVVVPGDVNLPRTTIWLAVRFNRDNCGVVLGSPALTGYSTDVYDFPLLNCNGNIGGFPSFPHASFNAKVYTDAACDDAYPGYRNIAPGEAGHSFGSNVRYADDLEFNVQTCDLIGYEIGVKGQASYSVDLRRDAGGLPGSVITGTNTSFPSAGPNIQIFTYVIDPPIRLTGAPNKVWMTVKPNTGTGKWIRTGRNAQVGNTAFGLARELEGGSWVAAFPADEEAVHGGYYAVLTCANAPPTGACCDMFVTDALGDSVCRTVPQMNCPFPPRGTLLRPAWAQGVACRVCDGGCNDGAACDDDKDCVGAGADGDCFDEFCVGGCNDNEACFNDDDCLGAMDGTCVDNDPFLVPCGKAACCTPQDTCIDLTRRECNAVEPPFRPRQWQGGLYCGDGTQRCPDSACLARAGECTEARERICNRGDNDGAACFSDLDCRATCFVNVCQGGCRAGLGCTTNAQCNCDGVCNVTDPNDPRCVGGAREGEFCDPDHADLDCRGSFCESFPGCRDPDCCTNVCDFAPGPDLFTEYCCQVEWDLQCAELARNPALNLCPGLPDANDTCAPAARTVGAQHIDVPGVAISGANSTRDIANDPGACCHQGRRVCSAGCREGMQCMIDSDCPGSQPGTCGVNNTCSGGCRAGQSCSSDANCLGAPIGTCVLPEQPEPRGPVYGTHWYTFTIPPAQSPEDPETISLQVDTCQTPNDPATWDSMVEVFSIVDSDRGRCVGLGRCDDLTVCSVSANDCADASQCRAAPIACSLAADNCPLGAECEFDLVAACNRTTSMAVIGCNDDAADGCGGGNRTRLSKLCLSDLAREQTYIIMVGGKRDTDIQLSPPGNVVDYRVTLTPVQSCTVQGGGDAVTNDYCRRAANLPFHPTNEILRPFDLDEVTWDCEPQDLQCASMRNDVWYRYRPDFNGTATFEACGPDDPTTPNTCLAIYDGCECPPLLGPAMTCGCLNLGNPQCTLGSKAEVDVLGGHCYTVRLTDDRGSRGEGTLSIQFDQGDCNGNGTPDNCEISCGEPEGPCDVPNCGTAEDCNGNTIPDSCDILIAEGGSCDPAQRLDCSRDRNMDGRPDECPNCPVGVVEFLDPPDGVIAAGYPADPGTCAAAGVDTFVVTGPTGAEPVCWRICETDDTGSLNFVIGAVENPAGTYTITTARPMTPGACTTISYTDNSNVTTTASFTAHPADANADGVANGDDISFLLDVLMGAEIAQWGSYSTDVDLDGASIFPDLLGLIDLLDGNGPCFGEWLGSTPVSCDGCPLPQ